MTYVSPDFKRTVFLHLYLNATALPQDSTPLFLLIYGPPGEGKTFQLRNCLREFDVDRHEIDSTAVEDPQAGRPDREIMRRFTDAAADAARSGRPGCVVMEDVHLLLGRYDTTQYTMNLQHVLSQLMLFADTMSNTSEHARLPVFMTANDTTVLAPALIRHGRARQYKWFPDPEEKRSILADALPELTDDELTLLTGEYPNQPVSFFCQARHEAQYDLFDGIALTDNPAERLRRALKAGPEDRCEIALTLDVMLRAASRLAADAAGGTFPGGAR
jgi:hypothetical protein